MLKAQGGQASALNAGFRASTGDAVTFLDADDTLLPGGGRDRPPVCEPGVVKVHWSLWEIDSEGRRTGNVRPRGSLPAGGLVAGRIGATRVGPVEAGLPRERDPSLEHRVSDHVVRPDGAQIIGHRRPGGYRTRTRGAGSQTSGSSVR